MITQILFFLLKAGHVLAANTRDCDNLSAGGTAVDLLNNCDPSIAQGGTFYSLVNSLINRIPLILGGLAFAAIIFSGVLYVGALGDPNKMESAKKNITWVFTGIIAISVIWLIILLVSKTVGNAPLDYSTIGQ